ncbi:MAG: flippase-like domain-containing protein [Dehalococcoidia bacterium]|nr:flippase-like domain-containing protein [Dehalococcoidia bacterium]
MSRGTAVRLGVQVAVSALFVLLAVRAIDYGELREAVREADLRWVPPALLLFTLAKYVDSWRWRYLLRGVDAPPQPALFGAFLIGNFVNNVLPLRAGDVAKIQVLANRYGTPRSSLASSVFVAEATLDAVTFVLFLIPLLTFTELGDIPQITRAAVLVLVTLAVLAAAGALALARHGHRLPVPRPWHEALEASPGQIEEGLHALRSLPRAMGAVALSVPPWLLEAGTFGLVGLAFGLEPGYPTFVTAMIAANVAVAVPLGLWNIGPYEVLVSAVLIAAGVSATVALSYAVAVHLLVNLWINVVGLVTLWVMRISPRDVLRGPGGRRPEPVR